MHVRIAYTLLITLLFSGSEIVQAQTFSDYKWESDMMATPEIPEEFKDAEAIILSSETYNQSTFSGEFPRIEQLVKYKTQQVIKINSEEALKEYKELEIPKFRGRIGDFVQMKYVDVRIRKKDGSVIDLKVRELPELSFEEGDDNFERMKDFYFYEIKDLEVGDVMEQINIIESKAPDRGRIVNLYSSYPVLNSSFTISVPKTVGINGRVYNGMPQPEIKEVGEQRIYSWKMEKLRAVPEANSGGTIFTNELEHFVYELKFDAYRPEPPAFRVKNFSDLIMQTVTDFVDVRVRSKKKVRTFYEELFTAGAKALQKASPEELSKLEKAYLMNEFVVKELNIVNRLEDFEESEGIDYFLTKKRADFSNLLCIYRDFFERHEFEYYLAVGKSRFDGDFDVEYVSSTQIASYLFVFVVEVGGEERTFTITPTGGLNELPSSLQGTTCLMKDITNRESELKSITFAKDPLENIKDNRRTRRSQIQVDSDGSASIKSGFTLSGLYSTEGRDFYVNAKKSGGEDSLKVRLDRSLTNRFDEREVEINKVEIKGHETLTPYTFKAEYMAKIEGLMSGEDGEMAVKGNRLMSHRINWVANAKDRSLDHHNSFCGIDTEEFYFVFPFDVELKNAKDLEQNVDNEFASYQLEVTQVKPNMIRIQSRYTIKKLLVPAEKGAIQQEVNEAWEKVSDAKWIFVKK